MNLKFSLFIYIIFFAVITAFNKPFNFESKTEVKADTSYKRCLTQERRADSLQNLLYIYQIKELRTKKYLRLANKSPRLRTFLRGWLNRVWLNN